MQLIIEKPLCKWQHKTFSLESQLQQKFLKHSFNLESWEEYGSFSTVLQTNPIPLLSWFFKALSLVVIKRGHLWLNWTSSFRCWTNRFKLLDTNHFNFVMHVSRQTVTVIILVRNKLFHKNQYLQNKSEYDRCTKDDFITYLYLTGSLWHNLNILHQFYEWVSWRTLFWTY